MCVTTNPNRYRAKDRPVVIGAGAGFLDTLRDRIHGAAQSWDKELFQRIVDV